MTFWTGHRGNDNIGSPFSSILGFKSGDEKIREKKKKRDNEKHKKDRRKMVGRRGGILEVNVY